MGGYAFEIISGKVVNAGATFTAWTMATGDSATVKAFPFESKAYIFNAWFRGATAGKASIRSPRMHDNVQGIRVGYKAATVRGLIPYEMNEVVFPQDNMTIQQTGGGAETDCGSLMMYYENLPGIDANMLHYGEVMPRMKNLVTVETQHTTGAGLGDYSGSLALNANFDLLKANVSYAILGYEVDTEVCSVGWKGPDTGNLRVGGPGTLESIETREWFLDNARKSGLPCVPVINAANKAATFVDLLHVTNAVSVVVQTILAELA